MPQVTVLLPYYNDESTLDQAVQSMVDQTYQDWSCQTIIYGLHNWSSYSIELT
jgi:glycosyltransferase involved in cell wall biosynthesis